MIPAVQFALIMTALGVVFSLFRVGEPKSLTVVFLRTAAVLAVGFPITYALFGYDAEGAVARQVLGSRVPVCARRCRADTNRCIRGARHRRRFAAHSDRWHRAPRRLRSSESLTKGHADRSWSGFIRRVADDGVVMRDVTGRRGLLPAFG